jgi:hypothetical protein
VKVTVFDGPDVPDSPMATTEAVYVVVGVNPEMVIGDVRLDPWAPVEVVAR